jgi:transposase InsO family protein
VAIDDASRLAYVELLPSLGQEDATGFLNRALAWYARLGAKVERVMTDNGSAHRSKLFAQALQQANARHIRTRPYTPRTNGKAERFIQTSLREWAYARPYTSSVERAQAIKPWADTYNLKRPHADRWHHLNPKTEQPPWKAGCSQNQ